MIAAPGPAEAAPGDGISGTVTSAGHPVQGIQVTACTAGGSCGASVNTGVNGTYSVIGLAPGDYYVTFRDQTTAYVTQIYPNIIATTGAGPGTPVHVTLDHVTTLLDEVAVLGSTFSGTVTDVAGRGLADIWVRPANADGYVTGVTRRSDSNGHFTTEGLPTGTYHLVFLDYGGRYLVPQWYDNLPDTVGQHSTATALTATDPPSNVTLSHHVVMQVGGNISGVATANGAPLTNVDVTLFPTADSSSFGFYGAGTDGAGRFTTQSVPPGSYKVGFIGYTGPNANTYFYYNNAANLASAATVTVTLGHTTTLGASSVPTLPGNRNPFGQVDATSTAPGKVTARGWALDPDTSAPIIVQMYVDGRANALTWASQSRPDVARVYPAAGANHGYNLTMSTTPGAHTVCLYAINAGPGTSVRLGCRNVNVPSGNPFGQVDATSTAPGKVTARGWALDPDTSAPIIVQMYVDGRANALTWASQSRPDVARVYPAAGANHGYNLTMSTTRGAHTVCLYAINAGPGTSVRLGCRNVNVP